jgi:hypothetical protein
VVTRADFELWHPNDVARILALVISERDYYQEILSALPAPMLIIAANRQVVWANHSFLRLTGLGVEDVRGKSVDQVLPAGIRTTEIRLAYRGSEETVLIAERAEATPMANVPAERFEALQAAAGRLAHDLNNPLMIVTGYAEELLEGLPADHALRSEAGEIQAAAARIAAVAARLTEFARKNANAAQPVDVAKVLNLPGGPLIALADRAQLEEAVAALAGEDRAAARCLVEGSRVCIALGRAAPGPEAALTAKLDSPEARAGLAAARAYTWVRQWGGDIVFAGVETRIYLARPEPHAMPEAVRSTAASPAGITILVVDDEAGIRTLVRKILAREGYRVLEAGSAEEALEAARRQRVDLLVTDVMLPRMAGPDLARKLHESDPGLRVLYISGFTPDETVRSAAFPPGAGFLAKPFTLAALVEKVRQALA